MKECRVLATINLTSKRIMKRSNKKYAPMFFLLWNVEFEECNAWFALCIREEQILNG